RSLALPSADSGSRLIVTMMALLLASTAAFAAPPANFFEKHCVTCHDANTKSGGFDITALKFDPKDSENFARWVKVHDRIAAGESPPKKQPRPTGDEIPSAPKTRHDDLVAAERTALAADGKTRLRRMTRVEYENTVRDLFAPPGLPLQADLPADGQVH